MTGRIDARHARRLVRLARPAPHRAPNREPSAAVHGRGVAPMMRQEALNFHPLVNTLTTTISRDGLVKFLEAPGHSPRILAVSGAEPAAPGGPAAEPP